MTPAGDPLAAFTGEGKLPPHDKEVEQTVLGALLVDADIYPKVAPILRPTDFFITKHGMIYEAIVALSGRGEPVNQVTVGHEMARHDRLEDAGGIAYLSKLVGELATSVGGEHFAVMIKRDACYRELIERQAKTARAAFSANGALPALLEEAEGDLQALREMAAPVLGNTHRPAALTLDELLLSTHSEVEWQVDGLIPRGGLVIISGDSESAKSYAGVMDLTLAIATGQPWLGRHSRQGRVLVIDEDNDPPSMASAFPAFLPAAR